MLAKAGVIAQTHISSIFDPNSISGLQLWLKADSLALGDTDPISTWSDMSGNGNDAIQSGANRPIYRTNQITGLPVVRFDGIDDYFNLTTPISSVVPYTQFIVYKKRTTGVSFFTLTFRLSGADGTPYTWFDYLNGTAFIFSRGNSYVYKAGDYLSYTIITQISQSGNIENAWANGTPLTLFTGGGIGAGNDFDTIGSREYTTDFADGDLAELLFYNTALSSGDRIRVENYLNNKYSLY